LCAAALILAFSRYQCCAATNQCLRRCAVAPVAPTGQLQAAENAIKAAEQARVADYAAPEPAEARNKLNAANASVQLKEMDMARRLAEQEQVDAELALARSQASKAQGVNYQMLKGTQSLKQGMQRSTGAQQ
jgi:hypothetical protein